jgi:hypothetical protein
VLKGIPPASTVGGAQRPNLPRNGLDPVACPLEEGGSPTVIYELGLIVASGEPLFVRLSLGGVP